MIWKENEMKKFFGFTLGAVVGALVGSTIALLLAPESGEALRVQLRQRGAAFSAEVQQAAAVRRAELQARLAELRAPRNPTPPPVA
jgi:gas vesicle protein